MQNLPEQHRLNAILTPHARYERLPGRIQRQRLWPGFAGVVHRAYLDQVKVCAWFGISQELYAEWCDYGAPVPAHIALRTKADLGMIDLRFMDWRIHEGWLISPDGKKISYKRLCQLTKSQYIDRSDWFD